MIKRTDRLNSLLREVISDVIRKEVRNPDIPELISITEVGISKDLKYAKVYVSIIGSEEERLKGIEALQSASGFIGRSASQQVVMRFFPKLTFRLDDSVNKQMRIEEILSDIHKERDLRQEETDAENS